MTAIECKRGPRGWLCIRDAGHAGPCALLARWWIGGRWRKGRKR